jgi:hypothetical protein
MHFALRKDEICFRSMFPVFKHTSGLSAAVLPLKGAGNHFDILLLLLLSSSLLFLPFAVVIMVLFVLLFFFYLPLIF